VKRRPIAGVSTGGGKTSGSALSSRANFHWKRRVVAAGAAVGRCRAGLAIRRGRSPSHAGKRYLAAEGAAHGAIARAAARKCHAIAAARGCHVREIAAAPCISSRPGTGIAPDSPACTLSKRTERAGEATARGNTVAPLVVHVFRGARPSARCFIGASEMSRSELVFWAVALAIFLLSGLFLIVVSHNGHSRGGYMTPSVILASTVE
jgi:hypothetical protein